MCSIEESEDIAPVVRASHYTVHKFLFTYDTNIPLVTYGVVYL